MGSGPGSINVFDLNYTYDARAKITSITDAYNTKHLAKKWEPVFRETDAFHKKVRIACSPDFIWVPSQIKSSHYDMVGRLTSAMGPWTGASVMRPNGSFIYDEIDYTYDALGNMRRKEVSHTVTGTSNVMELDYDANNRLTGTRMNGGALQDYIYDPRGNVRETGSGLSFIYDRAEQPLTVSGDTGNGPTSGTFIYDGNYKRVKQVTDGKVIYSFYSHTGQMLFRDNGSKGLGPL